jgi:hypothetical protein
MDRALRDGRAAAKRVDQQQQCEQPFFVNTRAKEFVLKKLWRTAARRVSARSCNRARSFLAIADTAAL